MTAWIIALGVAGVVIAYVLWTVGGARAANPEWNVGDIHNDGETDGFESDWDHYKQRAKPGDSGPGWDS